MNVFKITLMLAVCIVFYACSNQKSEQQEIIFGMEKAVKAKSTDEFIRPLIANYLQYYNQFKQDELSPVYLYRCAVLYYRVRNFNEAAINLERILVEYPDTEILEETYLTLAMLYERKLSNAKRTTEVYKAYLQKFPSGKGLTKANYFFRPNKEKLQDFIDNIIEEIAALPRGQNPSEGKLNTLMFAYINYIADNPDDPLAASYCLNAAKIAVRLERKLIAIQLLNKIYRDYEDFYQYPDALLLLAVVFDDDLDAYLQKKNIVSSPINDYFDREKLEKIDAQQYARKIFEKIIDDYPEHDAAASARACLKNLGKLSTTEIVNGFVNSNDSIQ